MCGLVRRIAVPLSVGRFSWRNKSAESVPGQLARNDYRRLCRRSPGYLGRMVVGKYLVDGTARDATRFRTSRANLPVYGPIACRPDSVGVPARDDRYSSAPQRLLEVEPPFPITEAVTS